MFPKWQQMMRFMFDVMPKCHEEGVMKTIPSIETQQRMHAFFMKTSAPRIYKKYLEEAERQRKDDEMQNENQSSRVVSITG